MSEVNPVKQKKRGKKESTNFYKDIPLNAPKPTTNFTTEQALELFLSKKDKILNELRVSEVQRRIKDKIFSNKEVIKKLDLLFNQVKEKDKEINEEDVFGLLSGQTFVGNDSTAISLENQKIDIDNNENDLKNNVDESTNSEDLVIRRNKRVDVNKNDNKKRKKKMRYESDDEYIDKYNLDKERMEEEKLEYLKMKYLRKYNAYDEESDSEDDYLLTSVLDNRESKSENEDEDFVGRLASAFKKESIAFNDDNKVVNRKLREKDEKDNFRFLRKKSDRPKQTSGVFRKYKK